MTPSSLTVNEGQVRCYTDAFSYALTFNPPGVCPMKIICLRTAGKWLKHLGHAGEFQSDLLIL